jgi:hypothetical protein
MQLKGLPADHNAWLLMREQHLNENMAYSHYTADLYKQYRRQLGAVRYFLLQQAQALVAPKQVKRFLKLGKPTLLSVIIFFYKGARKVRLDWFLKSLLLPKAYKKQIKDLDVR